MGENVGSAAAKEENKVETRARDKKRRSPRKANYSSEPTLNMAEVRELADLIDEHGFTDFEFENENIRIRLSKNPAPQIVQAVAPMQAAAQPMAAAPASSAQATQIVSSGESSPAAEEDLYQITSPIVGTFYSSPAPDKDPYVREGSKVSPETVVCIVEAMKLMNEIQAETSGEVVKIYVENGQPVEYGQPLFGIRK